ncbi:hypothetical protein EVAR_92694_1 [Eumeta japonica]|uniref:Uncharacterized protein n=1 Tax=Eumeta variegata TaxID=151549 RepID=A0A4C1SZT8_EUMVA|nr:hypothetical protein EVAR_92694_1 [Eumeta japonica]
MSRCQGFVPRGPNWMSRLPLPVRRTSRARRVFRPRPRPPVLSGSALARRARAGRLTSVSFSRWEIRSMTSRRNAECPDFVATMRSRVAPPATLILSARRTH